MPARGPFMFQEAPGRCSLIGCGPSPPPNCQNVEEYRPNGPGCLPVCQVCQDGNSHYVSAYFVELNINLQESFNRQLRF